MRTGFNYWYYKRYINRQLKNSIYNRFLVLFNGKAGNKLYIDFSIIYIAVCVFYIFFKNPSARDRRLFQFVQRKRQFSAVALYNK